MAFKAGIPVLRAVRLLGATKSSSSESIGSDRRGSQTSANFELATGAVRDELFPNDWFSHLPAVIQCFD
jgi:hypothetical protein